MMKVIKRTGAIVDFSLDRIVRAITKAMSETTNGIDDRLAKKIAASIQEDTNKYESALTVEEIQDLVEERLMNSDRKDVAKRYILYRNERSKNRKPKDNNRLLTDDFISKYKHRPSPMNQLGNFVYYRTYSRFLPEEGRREYWWETVRRAVEYNCSLTPTTREEAEQLFDNVYNLRQFLSGRTFWVGGTDVAKHYPIGNYNCAFTVLDNFDSFKDLFYLLMVGSGVGVRVLKDDVKKLPTIRTKINVIHKAYYPIKKQDRIENTSLQFEDDMAEIIVGDSKEGWTQSLDFFLKLLYSNEYRKVKTIIINYDNVRPKGDKLKTFGGTASGHESLKNMFEKIDKILKRKTEEKANLKPIDCLDIANIIGENVVVGGVRRTAEIGLIDSDDEECIAAKSNLYKQVDGQWIVDQDIIHRQMSNNSIYYKKKPSRERLHWQIQQMRYSGEPAWVNAEAGEKRRPNMNGVNPCFTGDMRLLTTDGFKTFEELNDKYVEIINVNGEASIGKVWCSGEKETIELILSNNKIIKCTPDHVFMTVDGDEVQAKDLKGKKIMPYHEYNKIYDSKYIKYGFMQGDGCLGRLDSDVHKGIEVNLGDKDNDVRRLFKNDKYTEKSERAIYLDGYKDELKDLGFDSSQLPNRKFPTTYDSWTLNEKASFLQGCYSANGSVIKKYRVAYKTTSIEFAAKLMNTLENDFGIKSYMTTNKPTQVEFSNGTYECRESYDVNIGKYEDMQTFHREIGFFQMYKKIQLKNLLLFKVPYVRNIKKNGVKKVYDFNEPLTNWGVVEGYIAHNCGEILLDANGLCNLTTLNVMAFVREDGTLDLEGLLKAQRLSARAGYRMTIVELELPKWNQTQQRDKLLGCSLTGWQDMVNAIGMDINQQAELLQELRKVAKEESEKYANQLGQNVPLLVTTLKPEGTLSQLPVVSSGVHYSHSPYYIRRVRINANDPIVKVCEELGYSVHPEVGQEWETCSTKVVEFPVKSPNGRTKYDVSAIEQLENYKLFMENYIDHNCSITVHVRPNEWEEVEEYIWNNWDDIVAVSFLALDDSFYQLLPYESIDEEEYNKRVSQMKPFIPSLISKYEKQELDLDIGNDGCDNGVCPIR